MNQKSFEKALAATARVACCSFLFGAISCKSKTPSNDAVPPASIDSTVNDSTVNTTDESSGTSDLSTEFPKDFDACIVELNTVFEQLPINLTDKSVACCEEYLSHLADNPSASLDYRNECCDSANDPPHGVCAPWGPPTPPKMQSLLS